MASRRRSRRDVPHGKYSELWKDPFTRRILEKQQHQPDRPDRLNQEQIYELREAFNMYDKVSQSAKSNSKKTFFYYL